LGSPLLSGDANNTTLYIIGGNKYDEAVWVRITYKNGILLSKSTIEGFPGGIVVAKRITELSHHFATT
jgi:hypothetical protein